MVSYSPEFNNAAVGIGVTLEFVSIGFPLNDVLLLVHTEMVAEFYKSRDRNG
jgi:hypothetical protein